MAEEIAAMRARLGLLADELTYRSRALEDSELRLLIAETPVADADRHRAIEGFRLVRTQVEALERQLEALEREDQTRAGAGP